MPGVPFTARSTTVQVLTGIVLVLFCVVFLRFVTLTFAQDATRQMTFVTTFDGESLADPEIRQAEHALHWATRRFEQAQRQMKGAWCGNDPRFERLHQAKQEVLETKLRLLSLQRQRHREATVQQELKLRAMQNPEVDETLRSRLGLGAETAPIPIMR